jgi:hypothetical protein
MKAQGKFVNSSFGGTDSARASLTSLTMFLQSDVPLPPLDTANVIAMQPCSLGEFLLREPALVAKLSH